MSASTLRRLRRRRLLAAALAAGVLTATISGNVAASATSDPTTSDTSLFTDPTDAARALESWARRSVAGTPGAVRVVPGSLLVTLDPAAAAAPAAVDRAVPGSPQEISDAVLAVDVAKGSEAQVAAELAALPGVVAVEPNLALSRLDTPGLVPDDPLFDSQWAHRLTGVGRAWQVTTGSPDVLVAVIDDGAVSLHPDLAGVVVEQISTATGEVRPGTADNDPCMRGHGTWTSGVVAATGGNGVDVAGVAWSTKILDINISDPAFGCELPLNAIVAAIDAATDKGARIINMSLGGSARVCPTAVQRALDDARAAGALVVAASGNSGPEDIGFPASCRGVVSVSAVGPDGDVTPYASTSPFVDVTAPSGEDLDEDGTLTPDEGVLTTSWWDFGERSPATLPLAGTSFSAPYVAGVAALLLAVRPDLTPDQLEAVLEATARDLGPAGRDVDNGWGLVDPTAAVDLVRSGGALPALRPDPAFPVGSPVGFRPGGTVLTTRIAPLTAPPTDPVEAAIAITEWAYPTVEVEEPGTGDDGGGSGVNDAFSTAFGVLASPADPVQALAAVNLSMFGAPLLYDDARPGVSESVARQLVRTLAPGARVYVVGDRRVMPDDVVRAVRRLGYETVRIAGSTPESTVARSVGETVRIAADFRAAIAALTPEERAVLDGVLQFFGGITLADLLSELWTVDEVTLVEATDWRSWVAAVPVAAQTRAPILVTRGDTVPATSRRALATAAPDVLTAVGGAVTPTALAAAGRAAGGATTRVIAGATPAATAAASFRAIEEYSARREGGFPFQVVAVDMRRESTVPVTFAATPLVATINGSPFVTVTRQGGRPLERPMEEIATGFGTQLLVPGGTDIVSNRAADALAALLGRPRLP